jgi:hypothetical protein
MLTAIELAEELLDKYQELVTDDSVRSHLTLYWEIAERVHKDLPCETVRDQDGGELCSLSNVFAMIYGKLLPVNMIATALTGDGRAPGAWL